MVSKHTINLMKNRIYIPNKYVCVDFARDFQCLAEAEGKKVGLLFVSINGDSNADHEQNYYENNGIWFFEPQCGKNKLNLDTVDFIELEHSYKGNYMFAYDKKLGWQRATCDGADRYHYGGKGND